MDILAVVFGILGVAFLGWFAYGKLTQKNGPATKTGGGGKSEPGETNQH